jgi:hypothetical protein
MPRLLNVELLLNPVNWVIVWLMLAIAAFAVTALMPYGQGEI